MLQILAARVFLDQTNTFWLYLFADQEMKIGWFSSLGIEEGIGLV